MAFSEIIQEIIDKRKGNGLYEGKGHLQIVSDKIKFINKIKQVLDGYNNFRNRVLSQIKNKKGDYYYDKYY